MASLYITRLRPSTAVGLQVVRCQSALCTYVGNERIAGECYKAEASSFPLGTAMFVFSIWQVHAGSLVTCGGKRAETASHISGSRIYSLDLEQNNYNPI